MIRDLEYIEWFINDYLGDFDEHKLERSKESLQEVIKLLEILRKV